MTDLEIFAEWHEKSLAKHIITKNAQAGAIIDRIAKEILPLMLKHRKNKTWVEPFVGGCNIINKVKGKRIGADNNEYLIALLIELQKGWQPIKEVTKDLFNDVRNNPNNYEKHVVAYIEILFTFGATWGRGI